MSRSTCSSLHLFTEVVNTKVCVFDLVNKENKNESTEAQ